MLKKRDYPYILFASAFLIVLTPTLFTDGMFSDGAIYSVISRNLAEGNGSFWHLHFSDTLMKDFYGHPPLVFYLTSIGFKIFGDSIFVERIYSLLTGFAAAGLIVLILKIFVPQNRQIRIVALFTWLLFPLVSWAYANYMLENTVTVFILLSTYFLIKHFRKQNFFMLFLAGISLFAAFMSKGLAALFIWSVPFFYFIIFKKTEKTAIIRMLLDSFALIIFTVLPFLIMVLVSEDAELFFIHYFNDQILGSLNHVQTVDNHFFIVKSFLNMFIIPLGIGLFLIILLKIKKRKILFETDVLKNFVFFFLIALAGILPIMISLKQRSFYIVPALPFLAVSAAFILNALLNQFPKLVNFFGKSFFYRLSYGLSVLSIVLIFIFVGKTGRDRDTLHDVRILVKEIPEKSNVRISKNMHSSWALYAYMQRYGYISLSDTIRSQYYLTDDLNFNQSGYKKINLDLKKYKLFLKDYE